MRASELLARLRSSLQERMPVPGAGHTAERHQRLAEIGREDLSLARLAEAHWDAVAILEEAGREPALNATYGVWASAGANPPLDFDPSAGVLTGKKMFCSGGGLVDHALITTASPEPLLFDIDLGQHAHLIHYEHSGWIAAAFSDTHTATTTFKRVPVSLDDQVDGPGWYLRRPGFWHGACGPAACWAGGAMGLVDYACAQSRSDAHTLAHLGAMHAASRALRACLATAGDEIDSDPYDLKNAQARALSLRHVVEQFSTDILRRLPRAYGPRPITMDEAVTRRYQELDVYLRQSHAERDLEALGRLVSDR